MRLPIVHRLQCTKFSVFVGLSMHLASYSKQHLLAVREVLLILMPQDLA